MSPTVFVDGIEKEFDGKDKNNVLNDQIITT